MKTFLCIFVLVCSAAMAQNSATTADASKGNQNSPPASNTPGPRPLAGLANVMFDNPEEMKSFLLPQFRIEQTYDSNAQGPVPGSDEVSVLEGSLTLQRNSKRRHFDLEYDGGATIYRKNSQYNSNFDRVALREQLSWRRTSLLVTDEVSYFPEAPFGIGNLILGGGGVLAPGILDLTSNVAPEQSILGQRTSRISNSLLAQGNYALSDSRSFTVSGSYGLLRFQNPLFIDSDQSSFSVGYNQALSARDTVSANFTTSRFGFSNSQSVRSQAPTVSYTRTLNGRFSADMSGGPEFTTVDFLGTGTSTLVSYTVQSSLRYRGVRKDLGLTFSRGVTGGSGILTGAETTGVRGYLSKPLSRQWSGNFGVGYSRNSPLTTFTNGLQRYDSVFADLHVTRPLSRDFDFSAGYQLQHQTSGSPNALTAFRTRHVVSIGFGWRHQPILIR